MRNFKHLLLIMACFILCCNIQSYAGGPDYYQGKGRIAISSDGNMHDDDDWAATAMTLMILGDAQMWNRLVLYTYCDHVWGSENNDRAQMKISALDGGEKFCFRNSSVAKTEFIEAVADKEAAYNAMRDAINESTAENPLFILAAGPMQVVGEGLVRADAAALNHVTIISHAPWNDKHADNPHSGEQHSGWTWAELETKFGTKVNFNHIPNQNNYKSETGGFATSELANDKKWVPWQWMKDHADPRVNWVYSRGKDALKRPDWSDAGMAYYLMTGDPEGGPYDLEKWIGRTVPDCKCDGLTGISAELSSSITLGDCANMKVSAVPSCATLPSITYSSNNENVATVNASGQVCGKAVGTATITVKTSDGKYTKSVSVEVKKGNSHCINYGSNYISFEADATDSDLGKWVLRKKGDPKYKAGSSTVPSMDNDYLEFHGSSGQSPLTYKFTAPKTATYSLTMRLMQNLQEGMRSDEANDVFIKLLGDYTSGCKYTKEQLSSNKKYFGHGNSMWGAGRKLEPSHGDYAVVQYNLKKSEEYTLVMTGRSEHTCIDYILLFESSLKLAMNSNKDIATHNDKKYWPCIDGNNPDPILECSEIKAVDFDKWTNISGFKNATKDNKDGKDILQIATRLATAAAQYTYNGNDADVIFKINAVQETDGESTFTLKVNGTLVGQKTNTRIHGTATPDYTIETHTMNTDKYALKNGDIIQVEFNNATNKLVPEGDLTATSRGRWYSMEICSETTINIDDPIVTEGLDRSGMKVIYTNSENTGNKKETILDNDKSMYWHTQWSPSKDPLPHEIHVDMGKETALAEIGYLARPVGTNGIVTEYEIFVSNDNTNWGNADAVGTFDWSGGYASINKVALPQGTSGRYVKFVAINNVDGNEFASMAEMYFYNSGDGEPEPNEDVVRLKTGWNLIGCPIKGGVSLKIALADIWDKVEIVKDFDGFYNSDQDEFLNSLSEFKYGKGYFIKVTEDCELIWE